MQTEDENKMHARSTCPQCNTTLGGEATPFCASCRFPLMTIAGKYQLEKLLAKGGFSFLYLARHIGLTQGDLRVVKVLNTDALDESQEQQIRFEREVELTMLLSLENEHIVQIFDDFGNEPNLGYYFVMEYLKGHSLKHLLRDQEALDPRLSFHIFRQLCFALHASHLHDIIHRDLKPGNIVLIERETNPIFLKLLDFGIARPIIDEYNQDVTKQAIGTPDYMSPEQCLNRSVDARSDIYSIGILLYRLLTGITPFYEIKKQAKGSALPVLQAQVTQPPKPLRECRPDLSFPQGLDDAILRALKKDPAERYNSAREFWKEIAPFTPPTSFEMLYDLQLKWLPSHPQKTTPPSIETTPPSIETPPLSADSPTPSIDTPPPSENPPPPSAETTDPFSHPLDIKPQDPPQESTPPTQNEQPNPTMQLDFDDLMDGEDLLPLPPKAETPAEFATPPQDLFSVESLSSHTAAFGSLDKNDLFSNLQPHDNPPNNSFPSIPNPLKNDPPKAITLTFASEVGRTVEADYSMVLEEDEEDDDVAPTALKTIPPLYTADERNTTSPELEHLFSQDPPKKSPAPSLELLLAEEPPPSNKTSPSMQALPAVFTMSPPPKPNWRDRLDEFKEKVQLNARITELQERIRLQERLETLKELPTRLKDAEERKETLMNLLPWSLLILGLLLVFLGLLKTC